MSNISLANPAPGTRIEISFLLELQLNYIIKVLIQLSTLYAHTENILIKKKNQWSPAANGCLHKLQFLINVAKLI